MNGPRSSPRSAAPRALLLLGLAVAGLGAANPPPATVLPAKAFFGEPGLSQARLSPDGNLIAFLFPMEGRMAIGVFDRRTGEAHSVVHGTDESILQYFWKGSDRLVFMADVAGNESVFIGSTDLKGKSVVRMAESQIPGKMLTGTAAGIVDPLRYDPTSIVLDGYFGQVPTDDRISMPVALSRLVARVNVRNGGYGTLFTTDSSDRYLDMVFDNAGVLRVMAKQEHGDVVWLHRANGQQSFREIGRFPINGYGSQWEPQFFSADNRTLYLVSFEEHDRGALYGFDTTTLTRGPALLVPPEGEIVDVIASYDRSKLYGVAYESDRLRYRWFDAKRAALQQKLENTFPGMECRVISTSADEQVRLVVVSSDRDPGAYFVLDERTGSLALFKRVRDLDPRLMRPMEPVAFAARDGLELHGYLTRPAGAEGRRVPLIIYPHGGPYGIRDTWEFDPDVQFLANRGYAVLQVNYRGSGGYGHSFLEKGRYQWGKGMQDDLTDAVKWAIAQGVADADRVAIYGASYGGYAALMGVELTPDLYRCGVNYVGVSDVNRLDLEGRAFMYPEDYDYLSAWIGRTPADREAISPTQFVDRIRVPTLHAYGRNDPRVEYIHWERLEARLKKYHKPYEAVVEKYQGHGFRDENQAIHFHEALARFLAKNLAPEKQP